MKGEFQMSNCEIQIKPEARGAKKGNARAGQRCSAELHSAVSRICNPRRLEKIGSRRVAGRFAGCNPAIRQIKNLRYVFFRRFTIFLQTFDARLTTDGR